MKAMIMYLVVGALVLTLYRLAYHVLFHNKNAWGEQRAFLLTSALLTLVTPLMRLSIVRGEMAAADAAEVATKPTAVGDAPFVTIMGVLAATYLLVAVFNLVGILYNLAVVWSEMRRLPGHSRNGAHYHFNAEGTISYSLGRHIVLGTKGLTRDEVRMIARHEEAHVRHGHTADLVLTLLLEVVFWFNPISRWFTSEAKRIHDYMADAEALQQADTQAYAKLLYTRTNSRQENYHPAKLLCNFKSGDFLKRIEEIYHPDNRRRPWCLLAIVPLLAFGVVANSCANPPSPEEGTADSVQAYENEDDTVYSETTTIDIKTPSNGISVNGKKLDTTPHTSTLTLTVSSKDKKAMERYRQNPDSVLNNDLARILGAALSVADTPLTQ